MGWTVTEVIVQLPGLWLEMASDFLQAGLLGWSLYTGVGFPGRPLQAGLLFCLWSDHRLFVYFVSRQAPRFLKLFEAVCVSCKIPCSSDLFPLSSLSNVTISKMFDVQNRGSAHTKCFSVSQEITVTGRKKQNEWKMANSSRRSFHAEGVRGAVGWWSWPWHRWAWGLEGRGCGPAQPAGVDLSLEFLERSGVMPEKRCSTLWFGGLIMFNTGFISFSLKKKDSSNSGR